MNRGHRLEKIERSIEQAPSASTCFECSGRAYRLEFELAHLIPPYRTAWRAEEAGRKIRELADSAEPDSCPKCGEQTMVGYVRERLT